MIWILKSFLDKYFSQIVGVQYGTPGGSHKIKLLFINENEITITIKIKMQLRIKLKLKLELKCNLEWN